MQQTIRRPLPTEHGAYYNTYISKVKIDNFLEALTDGKNNTAGFFKNIPAEKWGYKYGPEKWTIKEVMAHLIDTERVFAFRAMCISRKDKTPLPGFDENDYAPNSNANNRTPESLIKEYIAVRDATLSLFENLNDEMLGQIGTASGLPAAPLAIGFIIAGHELHHIGIIKERYL